MTNNLQQYKARKEAFEKQFEQYKHSQTHLQIKELIFICIALIPYAWCVNTMLVPHTIVSGALTGICEIIYFASNNIIPIWFSN